MEGRDEIALLYLVAFNTSCGEFLFVASCAENFLFSRDKTFRSNRRFADDTAEAFLVPLSGFVFHLFRTCNKKNNSIRFQQVHFLKENS